MQRYLLAALTMLLAVPVAASAQLVRTFDAAPGGRLVLDTERGSVEVRPGAGTSVRLEVRRDDDTAEAILEDFEMTESVVDGEVRIEIEALRQGRGFFDRREPLEIVATVPATFDLDLRTSGGSVKIATLRGDVRARTSGGSVRIGTIDGPVWARTSGGSVRLDGATTADVSSSGGSLAIGTVAGAVTARSSGGSISVDRGLSVDASTSGGGITIDHVIEWVEARSSGGGIHVEFDQPPVRDSRMSTSGGGVTVVVPPTAAFTLDARGNGARSDLPVDGDVRDARRGRLAGDVNGGGPLLQLRSSGGGVLIETR